MKNLHRSSRKGVSILEVTIVLVVFTIIIVATTTLIANSVSVGRKNQRDMEIAVHSAAILDCYRYAGSFDGDDDAFLKLLKNKIDDSYVKHEKNVEDENDQDKIILTKPDYSITVIETVINDKDVINIIATSNDGVEIFNIVGG